MCAQKQLWEVAVNQYGYVTTNNARMLKIAPVTVRQSQSLRPHHKTPEIPEFFQMAFDGKLVEDSNGIVTGI